MAEVTFTVFNLVSDDYVLVGPSNTGSDFQFDQLVLDITLDNMNISSIICSTNIPLDTPSSGTIRVQLDSGVYKKVVYTSWSDNIFIINSTDFSDLNVATSGNNIWVSYIDGLATGLTKSFTITYIEDRTLFIRVQTGVVTSTKTFESPAILSDIGGNIYVNRILDYGGIVSNLFIEYVSYNNYVTIDSNSSYSGISYPIGTSLYPVNNLIDAKLIAERMGIKTLYFLSDFTFSSGMDVSGYILKGLGMSNNTLFFESGCITDLTKIEDVIVDGIVTAITTVTNCRIINITGSETIPSSGAYLSVIDSAMQGVINFPPHFEGQLSLVNCYGVSHTAISIINLNNTINTRCTLHNYSGSIIISGCTSDTTTVAINLNSGYIELDSSNTAGTFKPRGVGTLVNNVTGICIVDDSGLMSMDTVADAVTKSDAVAYASYNQGITINTVNGTDSSIYPYGTTANPCKTLTNISLIAREKGFKKIYIIDDLIIESIPDGVMVGFEFIGNSNRLCDINVINCQFIDCTFRNVNLTGIFNNGSFITVYDSNIHDIYNVTIDFHTCFVSNMSNVAGEMNVCTLSGLISVISSGRLSGIELVFDTDETIIDLQYANAIASLDINSGRVTFKNANTGCLIELNMKGGETVLDSTCNGGDFYAEGFGTLYDNSTMIVTGNHLLSKETIRDTILDELTSNHTGDGTVGNAIGIPDYDPWLQLLENYNDDATFGAFIKKLLTTSKFAGIK